MPAHSRLRLSRLSMLAKPGNSNPFTSALSKTASRLRQMRLIAKIHTPFWPGTTSSVPNPASAGLGTRALRIKNMITYCIFCIRPRKRVDSLCDDNEQSGGHFKAISVPFACPSPFQPTPQTAQRTTTMAAFNFLIFALQIFV